MRFYQAMDLPGFGPVPGTWDHRNSIDVYLGHTDFKGMSVLDIGPANGFWTFEMERRGAAVTALELGDDDQWDVVPHGGVAARVGAEQKRKLADNLRDFWMCHEVLKSKARLVHGTVYDTPNLVCPVDVVLMGNILQHLRDPLLAIERAVLAARRRIIISEAIWHDDPAFLNSAQLYLIPRSSTANVKYSWYQVSPVFVMEALLLLGLGNLKCEHHQQLFNGPPGTTEKPRMVSHFTVSADKVRP